MLRGRAIGIALSGVLAIVGVRPAHAQGGCPLDGACCLGSDGCFVISEFDCAAEGGLFAGEGTDCKPDGGCPLDGACCLGSDGCFVISEFDCAAEGGLFAGEGTDCKPDGGCPLDGACCLGSDGCFVISEFDCAAEGGLFAGEGTDCKPDGGCPLDGACCLGSDGCFVISEFDCAAEGGLFAGEGTDCKPDGGCPLDGACCLGSDGCFVISEFDCAAEGGLFAGEGTDCKPDGGCPLDGACCLGSDGCFVISEFDCAAEGGLFAGEGTDCKPDGGCPLDGACCLGSDGCFVISEFDCALEGGLFAGEGTDCKPDGGCPLDGACCLGSDGCFVISEFDCAAEGGLFAGEGTDCKPDGGCPLDGACCLGSDGCFVISEFDCAAEGGLFAGEGTDCKPDCDADGDGFDSTSCPGGTDCDDSDGGVFPGNVETCDGEDDDCNGVIDDGFDLDAELLVDVQLENVGAGVMVPFTRCIKFELFNCDTLATATVPAVLTFDTSGLANNALVLIPCGDWDCITARDPLHTLRSTVESLSVSGQQYVANFTGGDALKGGNLNSATSNVIDIFDFGAFAGEFGNSYGTGNIDCVDVPPHADISGNGVVFVEDYTFIVNNFLDVSEANCCGLGGIAGGESDTPVLSISVAELQAMGLGSYAAGDLNGDGWLDLVDMQLFADGVWPTDDSEVRKVAFIGAPGSSWFDAGNWSDGLLPDANADVTIDVNVSIDGGGNAIAGDIAINSDAVLSVNAASLSASTITVHGGGMLMLSSTGGGTGVPPVTLTAQTLVISEGAMLAWNAGIIAADLFNSGLVDLGQPVAQLMLDGEFTQLLAGVLTIDIAGELDSLRDALIITGPAHMDGTLEVHLLDEYLPPLGTKLDSVIEAQQITGGFAAVIPPTTLPAGTFQHLAISESAVHIIYSDQPLLPADLNSDGVIGAADLAELLAQWGACPARGDCSADISPQPDGDGVVGPADLAELLAHWS